MLALFADGAAAAGDGDDMATSLEHCHRRAAGTQLSCSQSQVRGARRDDGTVGYSPATLHAAAAKRPGDAGHA